MKKKIIIIDDEPLISILMKDIIEEGEDLEIAAMTTSRNEFLNLVSQNSYDIALVDISVGGNREGGLELLQAMKDRSIHLPAVMLSAHDELHYALKCLQAGAKGYLNKKYICTHVTPALKEVLDGHLFVSGDKGEYILKQFRQSPPMITI